MTTGERRLERLRAAVRASLCDVSDEELLIAERLGRQGPFPTQQVITHPEMVRWLAGSLFRQEPMPEESMAQELRAYTEAETLGARGLSEVEVASILRRFHHRQALRIFLREIEGASLRQTTAEISDLAAVCLELSMGEASRLEGCPELAAGLVIFGMGKLGGRELNFSSDVDIVVVGREETLEQVGPAKAEAAIRLAVQLMEQVTDEGLVFRVDLRLRPEGSRGRLVLSADGLVEYYLNWGRTWERGVWLKARPIAGDKGLGEQVLQELEPFIFRRHLDFGAIDELRRMKEMIDEEARSTSFLEATAIRGVAVKEPKSEDSALSKRLRRRFGSGTRRSRRGGGPGPGEGRGEGLPAASPEELSPLSDWDVKVGRGGIREIEFFVQALQLVHCGTRPALRVRNTLEALDRLLYGGLVSSSDHAILADGYDLFRRLEHRVQMNENRQLHRLPGDEEELMELAAKLETDLEALEKQVVEARDQVHGLFRRLFQESPKRSEEATVGRDGSGVLPELAGVPPERLLEEEVVRRLAQAGFQRPRQLAGHLQVLRQKEHSPFSTSPVSARPEVARYLLGAVEESPDPEAALAHLLRFATTVGNAPAMWTMLAEHPHGARLLVHLFGSSPPLARLLSAEPEVFERLVYGGSARLVRDPGELERALERRLGGTTDRGRRMGRIHRFHAEEMVRIALHEVAGALPIEETCRQLTELADAVVRGILREVVEEHRRSGGGTALPEGDPVEVLGLTVLAMGKFGGGEMGFGSDLDFLFVFASEGPGCLDRQEATRLARRMVRALSAATAMGDLYEVDLRLRPSGAQGTLVVSDAAFREYHLERAQIWERQALLRARPITGTAELRQRLEKWRVELSMERELPEEARSEIASMRKKMGHGQAAEEGVDLKLEAGGLVDLEFLLQWSQLMGGAEGPGQVRSTFEALPLVEASGLSVEALLRDYQWLRRLECRLSISGAPAVVPSQGPVLRSIVRQMGHQGAEGMEAFWRELGDVMGRIRGAYEVVFREG